MSNTGKFKVGRVPWNKGLTKDKDPRVAEYGKSISKTKFGVSVKHGGQFKKGSVSWNSGTHVRYGGHKGLFGDKNPMWKGGAKTNLDIRRSTEYQVWRKAIFEKDDYTCVLCGKRGGKLIADHHPYPFHAFPDKRFDISNGRTLCIKCNYVVTYIVKNWEVKL